jgi:peroxiredoxin
MPGLANGDLLPALDFDTVDGGHLQLPDDLLGSYAVVLGYRGSWCPYCNGQLASFQRRLPQLEEEGIRVVAFSTDDLAHARETVEKHEITFPVGYGIDAEKTALLLGGYWNEGRKALESTDFLLTPTGTIEVAVYSSKVLGRLVVDDILGYVRHLKSR